MQNVHIVTDSCANFANQHFLHQHPVTVLPNRISIAGKTYRDGIDLDAEEALRLIRTQAYAPLVSSPSVTDYADAYSRLARSHEAIISIHASRELYPSWQNAKAAARQLAGRCQIEVIDSQMVCAAQGMLVKVAAKAIQEHNTLDDVVRMVRGAVERTYMIFYVETINYLLQNKIMSVSHSILGTMLSIKPFLSMEHGRIILVEKVRTRAQAIDRLLEFIVEFTDVEDMVILQHKPHMSEQTRMLQDRLAVEFPGQHFPFAMYSPTMAALIGADATGVVVLEKETEDVDDDDF
jgi:DegV family protein with EDD domain